MAKRFTDTNKYKKPFIRGLQGAYKLFWDYLYHDCDHAGIWIVDIEIAQLYIGKDMPINKADALKYFNEGEQRVIEIDNGTKWFLPSFISFQYGELNENNRAHNSVIIILKKYNLYGGVKPLISPLQGAMDMDKDMDKDKELDKDIEKEIESLEVLKPVLPEKPKRFTPPTLSEVEDYISTKKDINPAELKQLAERFINFYESKNWYVGKNKMTNWKAAATNSLAWERATPKKSRLNDSDFN